MTKKQKFPYLLGSKWTAAQKTWGWRHFEAVNRKHLGRLVFAEMVSSCDPAVRFWIDARSLKNREQWNPGWQTLAEMGAEKDDESLLIEC